MRGGLAAATRLESEAGQLYGKQEYARAARLLECSLKIRQQSAPESKTASSCRPAN